MSNPGRGVLAPLAGLGVLKLHAKGRTSVRFDINQRPIAILLLAGMTALGMTALGQPATAAQQKFFAYNMTTRTDFTGVYLAPAGTQNWGPNQALNDPDKSLDTTERLLLTGLSPTRYDVKLVAKNGRTCIIRGVDLSKQNSFEIHQTQLIDCH